MIFNKQQLHQMLECAEYYFGDERIFTIYRDGYIYYGGWKTL